MPPPLPPIFLLYVSSRYSASDPFSGYILINSVLSDDGVYAFRVRPKQSTVAITILVGQPNLAFAAASNFYNFKTLEGTVIKRNIIPIQTQAVDETTGAPIPVFIIGRHSEFIPPRTKRNVLIKWLPGTPQGPQNDWLDTAHGPVATGYIQHVTAASISRVEPFVARQLLELAQLKHEMCPITAEEYITGETAVMPCGHLFMRIAIDESFKTCANTCPACRQKGVPQFV